MPGILMFRDFSAIVGATDPVVPCDGRTGGRCIRKYPVPKMKCLEKPSLQYV
jgi:hypothetical protein